MYKKFQILTLFILTTVFSSEVVKALEEPSAPAAGHAANGDDCLRKCDEILEAALEETRVGDPNRLFGNPTEGLHYKSEWESRLRQRWYGCRTSCATKFGSEYYNKGL